jgi:hypothetical protein
MEDDLEGKQDQDEDEDDDCWAPRVPCDQQTRTQLQARLCDLLSSEILGRRLQICVEKS